MIVRNARALLAPALGGLLVAGIGTMAPPASAAEDPCRPLALSAADPAGSDAAQAEDAAEGESPEGDGDASADTVQKEPDVQLRKYELVTVELGPTGQPQAALITSSLTARDLPETLVRNPTSLEGIRYVDRLGSPDVEGSDALIPIGGDGVTSVATEAVFTKPLPVGVHAQYAQLPGDVSVDPQGLVGRDGTFSVGYRITNTVFTDETVRYQDARGVEHAATLPVFAPYAGTFKVVLPEGSGLVRSSDGIIGVDRYGRQTVTWPVVLYPPFGSYQESFSLGFETAAFAIPSARLELTPVTSRQDPMAQFSVDLLTRITSAEQELAAGLAELTKDLGKLAEGVGELSAGLRDIDAATRELTCYVDRAVTTALTVADSVDALLEANPDLPQEPVRVIREGEAELRTLRADLDRLAAGIDEAYEGSEELDRGAYELLRRGAERIERRLAKASKEPALAMAYIAAADESAVTALPYPAPEQAEGSASFEYVIAEEDQSPWSGPGWIALVAVVIASGVLLFIQRARTGGIDAPE